MGSVRALSYLGMLISSYHGHEFLLHDSLDYVVCQNKDNVWRRERAYYGPHLRRAWLQTPALFDDMFNWIPCDRLQRPDFTLQQPDL